MIGFMKSLYYSTFRPSRSNLPLIPAKAGIQEGAANTLGPRFRGDERMTAADSL
jgi:hypothetical protein